MGMCESIIIFPSEGARLIKPSAPRSSLIERPGPGPIQSIHFSFFFCFYYYYFFFFGFFFQS
jgi:hypothetical protein